jgi:hypothetical protein
MVKRPPEKLAQALRANLKRRKQNPAGSPAPDLPKDHENTKENPVPSRDEGSLRA